MNNITFGRSIAGILVIVGLCAARDAHAQACGRTASTAQFDAFYGALWGCQQSRVDDMWSRFHFGKGNWGNGMGYEDPCNDARPLKRTFNALQLLAYGVTATPTCSTSDSNVGLWAYCWSGNAIGLLDSDCDMDSRATTKYGILVSTSTKLHTSFFYDENVAQRAATIFHEGRHAQGWCQHQGNCARGNCDPNWANGCVGFGSGSGKGSNAYTVLFLNWFATTARATWINISIRNAAITEGNDYLSGAFSTDPCMRMNSEGYTFSTC